MRKQLLIGSILVVILVIGLIYPLIVMQAYNPRGETGYKSLVKTIYNTILENILVKSNATTKFSLNTTRIAFKFRSSIVKITSYSNNNSGIEVKLTALANIPSEYMLYDEDGVKTMIVIGYFVEILLPEKTDYLGLDSKLSYILVSLNNMRCNYIEARFTGSIVEFIANNSLINAIVVRLEESLMESYMDYSRLNYTGEISFELESYTSISYSRINISNYTKIRVVRENIGGVEEVNINGSRLYEYYYIDSEYYESRGRLHIAVKGFGSGIRIDLNRVG